MSAYHQQARRRIDSIESLREHLQWAVEIEHSTLPPYLCALYSLDPARNPESVEVVTSVFVEEMLHLTLAANLLNAVGGKPVLDAPIVTRSATTTDSWSSSWAGATSAATGVLQLSAVRSPR